MAEGFQRGRTVPYLRRWREAVLLTQKELAERAGVSRPTLIRAEHGEPISTPNVRRLAKALEVKPDALLYETPGQVLGLLAPSAERTAVLYLCALTAEEYRSDAPLTMVRFYERCALVARQAGYIPTNTYFEFSPALLGAQAPRLMVRHLLEDIRNHEYGAVVAFDLDHLSPDPAVRAEIVEASKEADVQLLFVHP